MIFKRLTQLVSDFFGRVDPFALASFASRFQLRRSFLSSAVQNYIQAVCKPFKLWYACLFMHHFRCITVNVIYFIFSDSSSPCLPFGLQGIEY
jgi:hypothetical protein